MGETLTEFLKDIDEIRSKIIPHVSKFVNYLPQQEFLTLIDHILDTEDQWRVRKQKLVLISETINNFDAHTLNDSRVLPYLEYTIKSDKVFSL